MNWFNGFGTFAAYLYLMRIPLLIATFLFLAFPLLAMIWLKTLLQNLFMLSVQGTLWTATVSFTLCWSLLLTSRLVLLNGYRFRLPQVLTVLTMRPESAIFMALLSMLLPATQFLSAREFGLSSSDVLKRIAAILAGALLAYIVAYSAMFVTVLAAPLKLLPPNQTLPAPKFLHDRLRKADEKGVNPALLLRLGSFLLRTFPKGLLVGYVDPKTGVPLGGHWLAFSFAVATAVLTFALDIYRRSYIGESSPIPALCYVVILLLNLNWILSFLAFLLDRYRMPLLIPILILCWIGGQVPSSDHYYRSQAVGSVDTITPYDVLHARKGKPIILVATAGGGIQAGAWTDQVLFGLQQLSKDWKQQALDGAKKQGGPDRTLYDFAQSLTLVSSVSGGATGSMYFVNLYAPDTAAAFQDAKVAEMQNAVEESSLDDVAWALVYRDFARIFLPYVSVSGDKFIDRGYALEESWRKRGSIDANLSKWRIGVKEGNRPAVIFNSTITETGEPLILSNTDLNEETVTPRRESFYNLYPKNDLPVVTAVRLAATFPYVSPAARIYSDQPEYHMIDGGYYDNPGIASLAEWLDEGLRGLVKRNEEMPSHILIIQIRSFPDDQEAKPTSRGWFFQAIAPVKGLLSVRSTAQLVRDHEGLSKLARLWHSAPEQGYLQDRILFATFTFPGNDAPLSWAMNRSQRDAIGRRWNEFMMTNKKDIDWVHCTIDEASDACKSKDQNGPY
jgi:hypothetical protein